MPDNEVNCDAWANCKKDNHARIIITAKFQANRAICASTDEKASIFTVTNKIPDLLSCYTMKSSNGTCMSSKRPHVCLSFLLCSRDVSFAGGTNSIWIIWNYTMMSYYSTRSIVLMSSDDSSWTYLFGWMNWLLDFCLYWTYYAPNFGPTQMLQQVVGFRQTHQLHEVKPCHMIAVAGFSL